MVLALVGWKTILGRDEVQRVMNYKTVPAMLALSPNAASSSRVDATYNGPAKPAARYVAE